MLRIRRQGLTWLLPVMLILCGCGSEVPPTDPGAPTATAGNAPATHGFLGVTLVDIAAPQLVVEGFVPESPAETSGLKPGDLLLRIDRQWDPTHEQLMQALQSYNPGDVVGVRVERQGEELQYEVELVSYDFVQTTMERQARDK